MMLTLKQLRTERIARARDAVRVVAAADGPIVLGPWLGEVGFELLYWIPFLRWVLVDVGMSRDRLVVVSRGGCAHWYADLADVYVELFDQMTPGELRVLNRERMAEQAAAGPDHGLHRGQLTAKQYGMTRAEREILRRVGLERAAQLHPSLMFSLFRLYWRGRCRDLYDHCTRPVPMPRPPGVAASLALPYVAVKFYSSQACPDRTGAGDTVRRLVDLIADLLPVVVLDSGESYDDHGSFALGGHPRVTTLHTAIDPSRNLALQTAVIAHASAFVGTYGGFAYLAPLLGVPTMALYAEKTFRDDHYQVISTLARQWGVRFDVSDLATALAHLQRTPGRWIDAA